MRADLIYYPACGYLSPGYDNTREIGSYYIQYVLLCCLVVLEPVCFFPLESRRPASHPMLHSLSHATTTTKTTELARNDQADHDPEWLDVAAQVGQMKHFKQAQHFFSVAAVSNGDSNRQQLVGKCVCCTYNLVTSTGSTRFVVQHYLVELFVFVFSYFSNKQSRRRTRPATYRYCCYTMERLF